MRLMWGRKDGGAESHVWAYGLEIKSWFSVLMLKFEHGSREAHHDHAFNAVSWLLYGRLGEHTLANDYTEYWPSIRPIVTPRDTFHRVRSAGRSWVLSFRGPWVNQWHEQVAGQDVTLTHGRQEVSRRVF